MKLLRIDDGAGLYRNGKCEYEQIDKLNKDDLLRLVKWCLEEATAEFDDYDEKGIKNQAHQIIYKSVLQKLQDLRARRREFLDGAARLFLEDYEKYRSGVVPPATPTDGGTT